MTLDAATALTSAEDLTAREGLIARAAALVGQDHGPESFVRDLFGRVPSEDLAWYSAEALGRLAMVAHGHLAATRRTGGAADARLVDVTVERNGRERDLTVVEVVNDNRAFLLDSALAELNGQGLIPLLVAHPIRGSSAMRAGPSYGLSARRRPKRAAMSRARASSTSMSTGSTSPKPGIGSSRPLPASMPTWRW